MRLWTIHPRYLDNSGLCGLWREALLAQAVLRGRTRGYRSHPQIARFLESRHPIACIAAYLRGVRDEARGRGLHFDGRRIARVRLSCEIAETEGQLRYEWRHLQDKLAHRAPAFGQRLPRRKLPEPHPLFRIVPGRARAWERKPVRQPGKAGRRPFATNTVRRPGKG